LEVAVQEATAVAEAILEVAELAEAGRDFYIYLNKM
jgi:hypothetical protein